VLLLRDFVSANCSVKLSVSADEGDDHGAGRSGEQGAADGTGNAARFNGPVGIVGDGAGPLYVSHASNGTIRAIRCP
jgi:hypothetical protein